MKRTKYGGWKNCIRLTNGKIELIATTDVGPRVIRLGFVGGRNLFKEYREQLGKTGGSKWRPYGGHRFWHAPEVDPRTYAPDNEKVDFKMRGGTLFLAQEVEPTTGIEKQLEISLDANKNHVRILHRMANRNAWAIEAAPWALSVMTTRGVAILPQEEYRPHPQYLLPARPLVLWHYTDMSDPRFTWGEKYIQLRQDPRAKTKNKLGMRNTLGWAAYALDGDVFIKRFPFDPAASYVDFGCNAECYTDPDIIEIESLGGLSRIEPGGCVEYVEHWYLFRADIPSDEKGIDARLLPLVGKARPGK